MNASSTSTQKLGLQCGFIAPGAVAFANYLGVLPWVSESRGSPKLWIRSAGDFERRPDVSLLAPEGAPRRKGRYESEFVMMAR